MADINDIGEPSDQVQLQLERLGHEASKYSNSQLPEDIGTEWKWYSSSIIEKDYLKSF